VQNTTSKTTLTAGQVWHPRNGERPRQIEAVNAAGITDGRFPMGTIYVRWAAPWDKWGRCSERAFRSWVKRTGAIVHG
jgi:hypothetical protein